MELLTFQCKWFWTDWKSWNFSYFVNYAHHYKDFLLANKHEGITLRKYIFSYLVILCNKTGADSNNCTIPNWKKLITTECLAMTSTLPCSGNSFTGAWQKVILSTHCYSDFHWDSNWGSCCHQSLKLEAHPMLGS